MIVLWDTWTNYEGNLGNFHFLFKTKDDLIEWLCKEGFYPEPIDGKYFLICGTKKHKHNFRHDIDKEGCVFLLDEGYLHIVYEQWEN